MKCLIYMLCALTLIGCARESPHIRDLKAKIAQAGATNLVHDAKELSNLYSTNKTGFQAYWETTPTNSLSIFGRPVRVTPDAVAITTAGLGSFRAGLLFDTSSESRHFDTTNYMMLAENIWFWTERR